MVPIRLLSPEDAADYRRLMLSAYAAEPEAFTATVAEREPLPLSWWQSRLGEGERAGEIACGAFAGDALVGAVALRFEARPRTRHKATLLGLYVVPAHRGRGLARQLVEALLQAARQRTGVALVQLTVTTTNTGALACYRRCGFEIFGQEPMAVCYGERYLDKHHLWRLL
jgi:ribosomal protein S18 acetylase RimI-like enzyme